MGGPYKWPKINGYLGYYPYISLYYVLVMTSYFHDDIFTVLQVDHLSPMPCIPQLILGPKPFRSQAVQGHLELLNNGEHAAFERHLAESFSRQIIR